MRWRLVKWWVLRRRYLSWRGGGTGAPVRKASATGSCARTGTLLGLRAGPWSTRGCCGPDCGRCGPDCGRCGPDCAPGCGCCGPEGSVHGTRFGPVGCPGAGGFMAYGVGGTGEGGLGPLGPPSFGGSSEVVLGGVDRGAASDLRPPCHRLAGPGRASSGVRAVRLGPRSTSLCRRGARCRRSPVPGPRPQRPERSGA